MAGSFPPDSRLPSEPELARIFGVSRMTTFYTTIQHCIKVIRCFSENVTRRHLQMVKKSFHQ
nr:GntR family transcriptional regulator [Bacillus rubiinfantis]